MELQELKTKLKKRLVQVEEKMKEVEDALTKQKDDQKLKEAHETLKKRRDEIILEYDQIEALRSEDEVRLHDLERNIYNSLDSFDSAYQKAGGLINQNKFRDRSHRIDFKDPQNTL